MGTVRMSSNDDSLGKAIRAAAMLAFLTAASQFARAEMISSAVYTLPVGNSTASTVSGVLFDGKFIWSTVQNPNGGVLVKIGLSGEILSTTNVGAAPIEMAFDGANIWVTDYTSSDVTIVNSDGLVLKTIPLPSANPEGIIFDGEYIWVANNGVGANSVTKFNAVSQTLLATYPVGLNPDGLAFDGNFIWVTNSYNNNVWKINRETGEYINGYTTGIYPLSIIYDGTNMWVGNGNCGSPGVPVPGVGGLTKIRAADGVTLGTYTTGNTVRGLVYDGTSIWVCNANDNTVSRLRTADVALLGRFATGKNPRAVTFDGTKIWIANSGENTITIIVPGTTSSDNPAMVVALHPTIGGAPPPVPKPGPGKPARTPRGSSIAPVIVTQRAVGATNTLGSTLNLLLDAD
jgi:DNA-binding beta-propeller fold protein YncE